MTDAELEALVAALLANFYERRLGKLSEITLATICRKNPYLFRAIGMVKPLDIIEGVLQAFLSSSEETVFGNIFFEPLVLAASQAKGERRKAIRRDRRGYRVYIGNDEHRHCRKIRYELSKCQRTDKTKYGIYGVA